MATTGGVSGHLEKGEAKMVLAQASSTKELERREESLVKESTSIRKEPKLGTPKLKVTRRGDRFCRRLYKGQRRRRGGSAPRQENLRQIKICGIAGGVNETSLETERQGKALEND